MGKVLNVLSLMGSFMVVFGMLYLCLNFTIGQLPIFRSIIVFRYFYLKDFVIVAIALQLISRYVTFYLPDRS